MRLFTEKTRDLHSLHAVHQERQRALCVSLHDYYINKMMTQNSRFKACMEAMSRDMMSQVTGVFRKSGRVGCRASARLSPLCSHVPYRVPPQVLAVRIYWLFLSVLTCVQATALDSSLDMDRNIMHSLMLDVNGHSAMRGRTTSAPHSSSSFAIPHSLNSTLLVPGNASSVAEGANDAAGTAAAQLASMVQGQAGIVFSGTKSSEAEGGEAGVDGGSSRPPAVPCSPNLESVRRKTLQNKVPTVGNTAPAMPQGEGSGVDNVTENQSIAPRKAPEDTEERGIRGDGGKLQRAESTGREIVPLGIISQFFAT